ncbi:hypothetical protein NUW54_g6987 [Trametes sanguinea]|uniref:Uncharacterized protein n=1 Tax=Trametes sanguinea TaxID=158606 RepID=A0ACC1PTK3_9APHY|nr:hypothetical protein NUW54_g6987 [Trametes sanguinea]
MRLAAAAPDYVHRQVRNYVFITIAMGTFFFIDEIAGHPNITSSQPAVSTERSCSRGRTSKALLVPLRAETLQYFPGDDRIKPMSKSKPEERVDFPYFVGGPACSDNRFVDIASTPQTGRETALGSDVSHASGRDIATDALYDIAFEIKSRARLAITFALPSDIRVIHPSFAPGTQNHRALRWSVIQPKCRCASRLQARSFEFFEGRKLRTTGVMSGFWQSLVLFSFSPLGTDPVEWSSLEASQSPICPV